MQKILRIAHERIAYWTARGYLAPVAAVFRRWLPARWAGAARLESPRYAAVYQPLQLYEPKAAERPPLCRLTPAGRADWPLSRLHELQRRRLRTAVGPALFHPVLQGRLLSTCRNV